MNREHRGNSVPIDQPVDPRFTYNPEGNGKVRTITKWGLARQKFTEEQVAWALKRNAGLIIPTAKTLQCSVRTIHAYLERYPNLVRIKNEGRTYITHTAEQKLVECIKDKEQWAIALWLKTKGGYSERNQVEHTGLNGEPIRIEADITVRAEKEIIVGMVRGHLANGYSLAEAFKNIVLLGIPKESLKLVTREDIIELSSNGNGSYEAKPNLPEDSLYDNGNGNGNGNGSR